MQECAGKAFICNLLILGSFVTRIEGGDWPEQIQGIASRLLSGVKDEMRAEYLPRIIRDKRVLVGEAFCY